MSEETTEATETQDAAEIVADLAGTPVEPAYYYADGVPGEGERPEYLREKYANMSEQAKTYTELEGRFGAFTGAPETYEVNVSDQLKESGVEIDNDDPLMASAMEFAQDIKMDQGGFDKMIDLYAMSKVAEAEAVEAYKADEMKSLGNNAEARVDNLNSWANANMPGDLVEGFRNAASSADTVKAIEWLVAQTRSAPVNAEGDPAPGGVSKEEIDKLMFEEKDAYGNRRYGTDKEFRKKVDGMMNQLYGSGDHNITIGG